MARKENPQIRAQIRRAISDSLLSSGYKASSYQAIAEQAGVSRALVQYYYPRKLDIATVFLNQLLEACALTLGIESYQNGERITPLDAYRIGVLYYGYLLSSESVRALWLEFLEDRGVTDEIMEMHCAWTQGKITNSHPTLATLSDEQIAIMGGFYELMHQALKQRRAFDFQSQLMRLINSFTDAPSKLSETDIEAAKALSFEDVADRLKATYDSLTARQTDPASQVEG